MCCALVTDRLHKRGLPVRRVAMSGGRVLHIQELTSLRLLPLLRNQQAPQTVAIGTCHARWDRGMASDASGASQSSGWMPSWLRSKLPESLGGAKGQQDEEELSLDKYASTLKQARRMGSVANMIPGMAKGSAGSATQSLQLYENVIGAMRPEEKQDLASFNAPARQRVAQQVNCPVSQVDDCIAKYMYMRGMTSKVKQMKQVGKPMPKNYQDLEREFGTWQTYRTSTPEVAASKSMTTAPPGSVSVPNEARGPQGVPCPWAGQHVGRSTKCPATRKSFKNCCGKKYAAS